MAVGDALCVSWLSYTSFNTTFLSKVTDYFCHMLLQRWETKIRLKEKSPQPGIELTTTRSWVRHAHLWANRVGPDERNKFFEKISIISNVWRTSAGEQGKGLTISGTNWFGDELRLLSGHRVLGVSAAVASLLRQVTKLGVSLRQ